MTEVLSSLEVLEPYAHGVGAQWIRSGERVHADALVHESGLPLRCAAGSLDYLVADSSWLSDPQLVGTLREWRRVLKPGGTAALLLAESVLAPTAIERLLTLEAGLLIKERKQNADGTTLLVATRDFERSLRRHFSIILDEIASEGRPENWKAELRFDLGSLLLQAGEASLAVECYRSVLRDDPTVLDARVGLALALTLQSDWTEAKEILEQVLEVDPEHGLAAEWLRRVHAKGQAPSEDPNILAPAARRQR